jgi:hypothetical protein
MDSQEQQHHHHHQQQLVVSDETTTNAKKKKYKILILGASYGSLLATKLLLAGHDVTLICRESTATLFNEKGSVVLMPMKGGSNELLEIRSKDIAESSGAGGTLTACTPERVLALDEDSSSCSLSLSSRYDLAILAMQEPQYSARGVRELVVRLAQDAVPTMAITNMPLLPYLQRIMSGSSNDSKNMLDNDDDIRSCFTEPDLWSHFPPDLLTQCSPDPQAFRPQADSQPNVLQVRLPTNFKAAQFPNIEHAQMLKNLERDIEAARFWNKSSNSEMLLQIPVKLRVHDSLYVPLAKWAMLLAGNYRCVQAASPFSLPQAEMRSIQQAVWSNIEESRAVYDWVVQVCMNLGAHENAASMDDFVPFEKYAAAAKSLTSPSSAARALAAGATSIERVDKLVLLLAARQGKTHSTVTATVAAVDAWLAHNQEKKKKEQEAAAEREQAS